MSMLHRIQVEGQEWVRSEGGWLLSLNDEDFFDLEREDLLQLIGCIESTSAIPQLESIIEHPRHHRITPRGFADRLMEQITVAKELGLVNNGCGEVGEISISQKEVSETLKAFKKLIPEIDIKEYALPAQGEDPTANANVGPDKAKGTRLKT